MCQVNNTAGEIQIITSESETKYLKNMMFLFKDRLVTNAVILSFMFQNATIYITESKHKMFIKCITQLYL